MQFNLKMPTYKYPWSHVDNVAQKQPSRSESKIKEENSRGQVDCSGYKREIVVFVDRLLASSK